MDRIATPSWIAAGATGLGALLSLAGAASEAAAQVGELVIGRVVESGTNREIDGATVELVGHGFTLTSARGAFRFDQVSRGTYTLRVRAFGFAPDSRALSVDGFTVADFALAVAPIRIDSVTVEVRTTRVDGQVRDAREDFPIVDAVILTSHGRLASTDSHGRFRLESVPEGLPLRVRVQSFGYRPVDQVLVPKEGTTYEFDLEEDPEARRLIDTQIERLEARIGLHWSTMLKPMNRSDLVKYAGHATLWDVLLAEFPRYLDRINCVVIDERVVGEAARGTMWVARGTVQMMLPEEVERMEFMAYGARYQAVVMRVYSREFLQQMVGGHARLVRPQGDDICE